MTDTKHTERLDALIADNAVFRTALRFIEEGNQQPGHCNYLSKARMAELAGEALAAAKGEA